MAQEFILAAAVVAVVVETTSPALRQAAAVVELWERVRQAEQGQVDQVEERLEQAVR